MKKSLNTLSNARSQRHSVYEKPWFATTILVTTFVAGMFVAGSFNGPSNKTILCSLTAAYRTVQAEDYSATPNQLLAILHYATTRVVPQQSRAEIRLSFNVLQSLAPCNFLVFGLGHDSLMWSSLNPRGTTLFLEEDPKWLLSILKRSPSLQARVVKYPTRLSEADRLLSSYKQEPECLPPNVHLNGNTKCKLALGRLPDEVYDKEWDVIMIDAPRGYFPEAPGRMGAIFTAAAMAHARTRPGVTHVFLHDVDRRVERMYAEEFLCKKYMVKSEGRLWHFEIPPVTNRTEGDGNASFCPE